MLLINSIDVLCFIYIYSFLQYISIFIKIIFKYNDNLI